MRGKMLFLIRLVSIMLLVFGETCGVQRAKEIHGKVYGEIRKGIACGRGQFDHSEFDSILRRYTRLEKHEFDYVGLKPYQGELEH
jgi:hypothetical protein